jgi:hypothetical protein
VILKMDFEHFRTIIDSHEFGTGRSNPSRVFGGGSWKEVDRCISGYPSHSQEATPRPIHCRA